VKKTSNDFTEALEARLRTVFEQQQALAPTPEAKLLLERLQALVLRAGKRSRPQLLRTTYMAYGGTAPDILLDAGVALELHHQFLLVHDDIMDQDTVRYDGPNMLGFYQQDFPDSDIPSSMALLAGNLLFTFACQAILNHPTLSDTKKVALLRIIQATNIGVHDGQQLDILNLTSLNTPITKAHLLQTNELKTALYSINLPMQCAAELLDLPATERQHIDQFARACGTLYQLVDDYADYFQNHTAFNAHPKFRDFRQGKVTYPLLYALAHTAKADRQWLEMQLGNKVLSDVHMHKVVTILENCGAQTASQKQITDYHAKAKRYLKKLAMNPAGLEALEQLLQSLQV